MQHRYTDKEIEFLKQVVPEHSYKEIQKLFTKEFKWDISINQVKASIGRYKLNTGRTGRFQKGHIPANKGKEMPKDVYEKCAKTMFKRGHIPLNTDPIGTEKMLADGYIWVKISDKPKVKKSVNWKQKHRLVWERHNWNIPDGHLIIFLDGDRTNCDISNLTIINKNQNARINQRKLRSKDKELTKAGIQVSKLIIEIQKHRRKDD